MLIRLVGEYTKLNSYSFVRVSPSPVVRKFTPKPQLSNICDAQLLSWADRVEDTTEYSSFWVNTLLFCRFSGGMNLPRIRRAMICRFINSSVLTVFCSARFSSSSELGRLRSNLTFGCVSIPVRLSKHCTGTLVREVLDRIASSSISARSAVSW